jgi:hypothetical protein
MANIPGTPSYWFEQNQKVEAIIENKGMPHGWYTISIADQYDPYLKDFLRVGNVDFEEYRNILRSNPHNINFFYEIRSVK